MVRSIPARVDPSPRRQAIDDLFAPLVPIMYLIAWSDRLADFAETNRLPREAQNVKDLCDLWRFQLSEVEGLIPRLATLIDKSVESRLERWTVDFLARIQKVRWRIRGNIADSKHGPPLREFILYLQDRHAELKAMLTVESLLGPITTTATATPSPPRSVPMSKTELTRRIHKRHKARPREISDEFWQLHDLQPVPGRKHQYTIRLDRLDDDARKRVEA